MTTEWNHFTEIVSLYRVSRRGSLPSLTCGNVIYSRNTPLAVCPLAYPRLTQVFNPADATGALFDYRAGLAAVPPCTHYVGRGVIQCSSAGNGFIRSFSTFFNRDMQVSPDKIEQ